MQTRITLCVRWLAKGMASRLVRRLERDRWLYWPPEIISTLRHASLAASSHEHPALRWSSNASHQLTLSAGAYFRVSGVEASFCVSISNLTQHHRYGPGDGPRYLAIRAFQPMPGLVGADYAATGQPHGLGQLLLGQAQGGTGAT